MRLSKLDAARIQLDSAIESYFRQEHVCAVTLAGAAEDILAGLLQAKGEQSPFEFLHDWYQGTYATTVSRSDFSKQIANPARNWLKHADTDAGTSLDITERDSLLMFMRALPCYYTLTGSHTDPMRKFHRYVHDNIEQVNRLFA
jgi:hypothetical protein